MKAISLREPYASLMLFDKIETRKWKTDYRGPVLLCASKKPFTTAEVIEISGEDQFHRIRERVNMEKYTTLGMAIAIAELADCRPMLFTDQNACFVQYNLTHEENGQQLLFSKSEVGLWCHVYKKIQPIKPFRWEGSLMYSDVPQKVIKKIKPL